ncbi:MULTISPECIES: HIT family protein [unclassified Streptomyces]|uniref:HIT family protein n=1 Tax=unclassified Streptomyces TaxID=2593676 RepID=UPI002259EF37|nr:MULTISPECIES: HIT family protein [unclassified Streptomyces]MCX5049803.1 HIT family protein [Streptomyces sp. NBC_00474]MCX5060229.1 HIT family protein [Streptomyces sp. NBC_00452]MCX5247711.1 HIT family protein [Streptomyces sp. NBC_00201]MCX5286479.1 HIT family protein [Streptomyces sp. NBC_00183]
MTLYYFGNCRTEEQRAEMERLDGEGICLFCPDVIRSHEKQQILRETAHWMVTPNEFPYAGTRLHLLLIPKEHVTDLLDLSSDARADFWEVLAYTKEKYGMDHYGLGARNGDCRYTGGTIRHLHVHVLVGEGEVAADEDFTPVRMRFSSSPGR